MRPQLTFPSTWSLCAWMRRCLTMERAKGAGTDNLLYFGIYEGDSYYYDVIYCYCCVGGRNIGD